MTALKEPCPSKYVLKKPTQHALLLSLDLLQQSNTFFISA